MGTDPSLGRTAAQNDITALLRERHQIPGGAAHDFQVRNPAEIASAQEEGDDTMTTLLTAIAAASLAVGGIGIMNIMLVSVTERMREIGVCMVIGARPRHILPQFLVKALTLSLLGGLLGVSTGRGAARNMAPKFGWTMVVQPQIVALAVGFSAAVGVVFGLYPAYKASRLDPIRALRFEQRRRAWSGSRL